MAGRRETGEGGGTVKDCIEKEYFQTDRGMWSRPCPGLSFVLLLYRSKTALLLISPPFSSLLLSFLSSCSPKTVKCTSCSHMSQTLERGGGVKTHRRPDYPSFPTGNQYLPLTPHRTSSSLYTIQARQVAVAEKQKAKKKKKKEKKNPLFLCGEWTATLAEMKRAGRAAPLVSDGTAVYYLQRC